MRWITFVLLLLGPHLLCGCAEKGAIYFYESEKVSLTLEGKPDASEPVSGNLGIKQHMVMALPGISGSGVKDDNDALSVISYFDFQKGKDPTRFLADPVDIRTAFIAGSAAREVTDPGAALQALTGTGTPTTTAGWAVISTVYGRLKEMSAQLGHDGDNAKVLVAALDSLVVKMPDTYAVQTYQLTDVSEVTVDVKMGAKILPRNFDGVISYVSSMRESLKRLDGALAALDRHQPYSRVDENGTRTTVSGQAGDAPTQSLLGLFRQDRAQTVKALDDVMTALRGQPAVDNATQFFLSSN